VVAEEVRRLAERAGKLLEELVPNIRKTADLVREVAAGSAEQAAGVTHVGKAMASQTTSLRELVAAVRLDTAAVMPGPSNGAGRAPAPITPWTES
jgi:methyl-accepting chemotaxis protein